ncbi:MAG: hypothetical protein Q8R00_04420 [Candidatus Nanoarchaeia archaeon]|nr:hypothetical protein [Candidatus Nanoarchaeia archaeon]
MPKNLFQIIIETIFWILLVIFVYQLVLKITGHSPTELTILYSGFTIIVTYLLTATYRLGKFTGHIEEFMGTTKEFMRTTKESFVRNREDTSKIKEELSKIRSAFLK